MKNNTKPQPKSIKPHLPVNQLSNASKESPLIIQGQQSKDQKEGAASKLQKDTVDIDKFVQPWKTIKFNIQTKGKGYLITNCEELKKMVDQQVFEIGKIIRWMKPKPKSAVQLQQDLNKLSLLTQEIAIFQSRWVPLESFLEYFFQCKIKRQLQNYIGTVKQVTALWRNIIQESKDKLVLDLCKNGQIYEALKQVKQNIQLKNLINQSYLMLHNLKQCSNRLRLLTNHQLLQFFMAKQEERQNITQQFDDFLSAPLISSDNDEKQINEEDWKNVYYRVLIEVQLSKKQIENMDWRLVWEMKAYKMPPARVLQIIYWVGCLFMDDFKNNTYQQTFNNCPSGSEEWLYHIYSTCIRRLFGTDFKERIKHFDIDSVRLLTIRFLKQRFLNNPELDYNQALRCSRLAAIMLQWVNSVYNYCLVKAERVNHQQDDLM